MPIYEYVCSACNRRTDILHGVNESGPHFCPECGAEGSMRKAFAPPAIVFKGTGWAKKDRSSTSRPAKSGSKGDGESSSSGGGSSTTSADSTSAESSSASKASSDAD